MFRRYIQNSIQRSLADTPVVLLNGARQTGKTTLAQMMAAQLGAVYLTLDDAATFALAAGDPAGFIQNLDGPVILDEIQKVPDLFPAIKLVVDRNRRPGRFLLTGSANVMTLPRLAESLAGRMEILPLYPLSAGEITGTAEGFLPRLFEGGFAQWKPPRTEDDIQARLTRGGYPEAVQRENPDRRGAWFASYISAILQRDVRDLARVEALHTLPNLLQILAARTSGLLNVADAGRDAGLPHTTMTRYLALLETVFLVHRLPAWSRNLGQRLVKAPKLHVVDTGLACHLVGADARRLSVERPLLGRILESFVVGELRKQISWTDPRTALYHFRAASGMEVDVVLEKPDGSIAAIEVKASATLTSADFAGLRLLRDQVGPQFHTGVVCYLGDRIIPSSDKLWGIPLPALWAP
jgi:predicted AAA+ superfamily ATPase